MNDIYIYLWFLYAVNDRALSLSLHFIKSGRKRELLRGRRSSDLSIIGGHAGVLVFVLFFNGEALS